MRYANYASTQPRLAMASEHVKWWKSLKKGIKLRVKWIVSLKRSDDDE
jgi:hypothetical protein